MDKDQALRAQLAAVLDWQDAHASFEAAVADLAPDAAGKRPGGSPHSCWQLLEHMRRGQADILDFCRNPNYVELEWPADYWPSEVAPPDAKAWKESVTAFRKDRDELKQLCADPGIDLFARIPHGQGQTYLREILLAADHNAYHLGQLVAARSQLGQWKSS